MDQSLLHTAVIVKLYFVIAWSINLLNQTVCNSSLKIHNNIWEISKKIFHSSRKKLFEIDPDIVLKVAIFSVYNMETNVTIMITLQ